MKYSFLLLGLSVLLMSCDNPQSTKTNIPTKPVAPSVSIHDAAKNGSVIDIKQHLAAGTNVDKKNDKGWTPLFHAVVGDQPESIKLLIQNGADVNAPDKDLFTPLFYAVYGGFGNTLELLISNGADVNLREISGKTPLDLATKGNVISILRKHGAKNSQ